MSLDTKIISDCKKGKASAQDKIYDLYSGAMLGICARYATDISEAEDILQESFIKVFVKIPEYDFSSVASFSAWMKKIVVNTALNYIRDQKKHKIFDEINEKVEMYAQPQEAEDQSISISQKEILELIQQLPDGYRIVFNLYVFEKFSHQDIATELDISVSTSKTQLFKARKMLQGKVMDKLKGEANRIKSSL